MLSKEEIENKLEQTEDDEITINLLYQEVDVLETKIEQLETNNKKLIEKLEEKIRYFEENEEFIASNNDNYSDGTVIYKFITEFKEILKIAKGEKE